MILLLFFGGHMKFTLSSACVTLALTLMPLSASAETFSLPNSGLSTSAQMRWQSRPVEPGAALVNVPSPVRSENLLGRGYNGLSAELRGTCLAGKATQSGNDAKKVDYSLHLAGSSDEYRRDVNMSAAASFGLGTWSTDASVAYFQSSARSNHVDHLVVRVVVTGPMLTFDDPKLTSDAKQRVKNSRDFYRLCGNRYVKSLSIGGEFSAVIDIETNSESERSDLRSTLSVVAKGYGSASAEYAEAVRKISSSYQKNVKILRNGTGEAIPNLDIETIIKYSLDFPTKISALTGVPVGLEYADYRTVDPAIEIFSAQEIVVEGMSDKFGDLFELLGDLDFYDRHRALGSFYPPLSDEALQTARNAVGLAAINAKLAFNACVEDPQINCKLSLFPDVKIDAPKPAQQTTLQANTGVYQPVGTAGSGEEKTIIIIGSWSAWSAGENLWWPPERCCFSVVIAGENGPPTAHPYTGPIKFSGPARVSVHVEDGTYEDNRSRGLAAIIY
jgi:hypothetical protein